MIRHDTNSCCQVTGKHCKCETSPDIKAREPAGFVRSAVVHANNFKKTAKRDMKRKPCKTTARDLSWFVVPNWSQGGYWSTVTSFTIRPVFLRQCVYIHIYVGEIQAQTHAEAESLHTAASCLFQQQTAEKPLAVIIVHTHTPAVMFPSLQGILNCLTLFSWRFT